MKKVKYAFCLIFLASSIISTSCGKKSQNRESNQEQTGIGLESNNTETETEEEPLLPIPSIQNKKCSFRYGYFFEKIPGIEKMPGYLIKSIYLGPQYSTYIVDGNSIKIYHHQTNEKSVFTNDASLWGSDAQILKNGQIVALDSNANILRVDSNGKLQSQIKFIDNFSYPRDRIDHIQLFDLGYDRSFIVVKYATDYNSWSNKKYFQIKIVLNTKNFSISYYKKEQSPYDNVSNAYPIGNGNFLYWQGKNLYGFPGLKTIYLGYRGDAKISLMKDSVLMSSYEGPTGLHPFLIDNQFNLKEISIGEYNSNTIQYLISANLGINFDSVTFGSYFKGNALIFSENDSSWKKAPDFRMEGTAFEKIKFGQDVVAEGIGDNLIVSYTVEDMWRVFKNLNIDELGNGELKNLVSINLDTFNLRIQNIDIDRASLDGIILRDYNDVIYSVRPKCD